MRRRTDQVSRSSAENGTTLRMTAGPTRRRDRTNNRKGTRVQLEPSLPGRNDIAGIVISPINTRYRAPTTPSSRFNGNSSTVPTFGVLLFLSIRLSHPGYPPANAYVKINQLSSAVCHEGLPQLEGLPTRGSEVSRATGCRNQDQY